MPDASFTTAAARAVADAHTTRVLLALAETFDGIALRYRDDATAYSYEAGVRRTWQRAAELLRRAVVDDIDLRRIANG